MFHARLIELESEIIAKEQSARGFAQFPEECNLLLAEIEKEVGISLAHRVPPDWKGWVVYRRNNRQSLVVCRGRAFKEGGVFGSFKAGLDVPFGLDTVTEYARGFDVTPPQDLDHLLINFGQGQEVMVFLWYGENIAPYKLIYKEEISEDPEHKLKEAIVEACTWILTRPKEQTLVDFLRKKGGETPAM